MKMIPARPGNPERATCPDCKRTYSLNSGHACTAKKDKRVGLCRHPQRKHIIGTTYWCPDCHGQWS